MSKYKINGLLCRAAAMSAETFGEGELSACRHGASTIPILSGSASPAIILGWKFLVGYWLFKKTIMSYQLRQM